MALEMGNWGYNPTYRSCNPNYNCTQLFRDEGFLRILQPNSVGMRLFIQYFWIPK